MPRNARTEIQDGPGDQTALKGVRRALQVLEHVAIHPGRATDLADALDLSWATLHRTLSQLEKGGFLQRDRESNRYSIGPRMWFIGATYIANHRVLELAKPYLAKALKSPGITVQLVERSGFQAVALYSSHSDEEITKATYGYHFPLHTGSKGQVLLAYAEPGFIDEYLEQDLERLTPFTVTNAEELRSKLEGIREQGYAVTVADVQPFTGSVAAPVFDHKGTLVACVCFVSKKSNIENASKRDELIEALLTTVQSISLALGWRPQSK